MENPLKKINSVHREIMWRDIHGQSRRNISKILGIAEGHIAKLFSKNKDGSYYNSLFGNEYEKLLKEVHDLKLAGEGGKLNVDAVKARIDQEALNSIDTMVSLRNNATSERVRQLSAIDILDRAGFKPTEKIAGKLDFSLSEETGERVAKALKEMRK